MWILDSETLFILAVNEAAIKRYGYSREEFLKLTIEDLRPAEEKPELRAPREQFAAGAAGVDPSVSLHQTRDGRILHVESTWHKIPWEGRTGVLVVTQDRSAQRLGEERNREQGSLLNLATDAILVRDMEGSILYWNEGAQRLYGWSSAEVLGRKMHELPIVEESEFLAAEPDLLGEGAWSGAVQHLNREGARLEVNSRCTLVRDERGRPATVLTINTDVTEMRKFEGQFLRAQRLDSIGALASGIAHDLNNILSPILMSIGVLRQSFRESQTQRLLQIIENSAERGAGIVKQVLTFARGVEGERILLQPKHLILELAKIMAQTFPRNIDIRSRFSSELWSVNGDVTQLHQLLLNLCVNARDAMPAGGTLTISAENLQVDTHFASMNPGASVGPHVVLEVSDTGTGMPPETLKKIFDPFFTTKKVGQGTGLGLATVMGIVKSHAGVLTVRSVVGSGTTFRIVLPAADDAVPSSPPAGVEEVIRGRGELVLIVDDEPEVREALVSTLQSSGYRVYAAEDGSDALALYFQRRGEIDVVLTDIAMENMDGVALVRSLRKLNPAVKVIASSGHFQSDNLSALNALGVDVILNKPYNAEKLLSALHAALHNKAGGRE